MSFHGCIIWELAKRRPLFFKKGSCLAETLTKAVYWALFSYGTEKRCILKQKFIFPPTFGHFLLASKLCQFDGHVVTVQKHGFIECFDTACVYRKLGSAVFMKCSSVLNLVEEKSAQNFKFFGHANLILQKLLPQTPSWTFGFAEHIISNFPISKIILQHHCTKLQCWNSQK